MLENGIVMMVNKFLSTYLKDVDPTDLSLSILKGEVILSNVRVNTTFLNSMNLPVSVKEVYIGNLVIKFPWTSLNRSPIAVEVDDVYVLVATHDLDEENEEKAKSKVAEVITEKMKEASNDAAKVEEKKDTVSSKEMKPSDPGAITDFSGAFSLVSSLVNNFKFTLRRMHIRLEGTINKDQVFSLGVALNDIVFDTIDPSETMSDSDVRKSFNMNGLSLYWCLRDDILLSLASEEKQIEGMKLFFKTAVLSEEKKKNGIVPAMQYNPDDRLLDDMNLHVQIVGDLRKIDDRKRLLTACMEETCEKLHVVATDPIDAVILAYFSEHDLEKELKKPRNIFAQDVRDAVNKVDDYKSPMGLRARHVAWYLWDLSKTPSPMLRVEAEIDKIDLEIEKSQYENIACFANDFLSSLPASEPKPLPVVEDKPVEEKKEEKTEEVTPHYVFGVISFVCWAANYVLTSYINMFSIVTILILLPYLLFHSWWQALLLIGALGGFGYFAFNRLQKRSLAYNVNLDKEVHCRENLVDAGFLMKKFELRLNNDMVRDRDVEHIMALCVNDVGVNARVGQASIGASLTIRDVHIRDMVSSELQHRDRMMMCVCSVDAQGCPSNVIEMPLLVANVLLVPASSPNYKSSDSDIDVRVHLGQANFVISRMLLYSLLRFVAPSEPVKKLLKKAAIEADKKTLALKELSDAQVNAPPKPVPLSWERKSVNVVLVMESASVLLDSETGGVLMMASVSVLKAEVAISAAKLELSANIHDVSIRDCSSGCGLYPDVLAINHDENLNNSARNDFLDAGVKLFNDDRWENYPGYSIAAQCSVGAPILTVRMRFLQELMNYVLEGPIMDGLALLNDEAELSTSGNLKELESPEEDTKIMENLMDCAKTIGMQYIVTNEQEVETHIVSNLCGVANNLKRMYIVPNPADDNVPTEIPHVDVLIANTVLRLPRASTSSDMLAVCLGKITVHNSEPERESEDSLIINKQSVVYTLNKVDIKVSGVAIFTTISDRTQTIMGSIDLKLSAIVAVKVEASIYMTHIVMALSEDQVLTLINLITMNLSEKPILMCVATKPVKKLPEPVRSLEHSRVLSAAARASQRISQQMNTAMEEAKKEADKMDEIEEADEIEDVGFMPRSDSCSSISSSLDLTETSMLAIEEEKPPKENNSVFADRIHVNILFDGITIELFRGDSGYDGVLTSSAMEPLVGTVAGSIACFVLEDMGIKAFCRVMGDMEVSAAVSLANFVIKDSRPESPLYDNFRTLLRLGDDSKPAFTLIASVQQKTLGDLSHVMLKNGHKVNEPVLAVEASMFLGQVSILPSPWIFTLLDWATAVGAKVSSAFADATASAAQQVVNTESSLAEEAVATVHVEEEDMVSLEEKETSLIPNVVVKMHLDRMALYVVEDCTTKLSPVFLFCFGVEIDAHVNPYMDILCGLRIEEMRGSRSNSQLQLLPVAMRDAIYPFVMNISASVMDNVKDIRVKVAASELTLRFGILDAKLFINFATNLLPKAEEKKDPVDEKKPVEEIVEMKEKTDILVAKPTPVVKEAPKPVVNPMRIQANVLLEKIAFILVNDALDYELPVVQFNINQVKVDAAMGRNLYAHVGVAFQSDYYKASQALWEPFMEHWSMSVNVKQISELMEKDPFVSMDSQKDEVESKTMCISIDAPKMLQMNVTSTLLSSLAETLGDFLNCNSSSLREQSGFYVGIKNTTGFDMKYRIDRDGGINQLITQMDDMTELAEARKDRVLFADVVDVAERYRIHSRWLEFHSQEPHLRIYQHIPLIMDSADSLEHNLVSHTDEVFNSDATLGHIFPVAFYMKKDKNEMYVESLNDERRDALLARIEDFGIPAGESVETLTARLAAERSSYVNSFLDVSTSITDTKLPAYPSLALLFLKQNYRRIPDRMVSIKVGDFEPFACIVDRERVVLQPLVDSDGVEYAALVRSCVKNGRKVLDVTSNLMVENLMEEKIFIRFESTKSEQGAEVIPLDYKAYECCPLNIIHSAQILVSLDDHFEHYVTIDVNAIQNGTVSKCVNVSGSDKPVYARVAIHRETVYDVFNKQSVESYRVSLTPVMAFVNLLPVPMDYRVMKGDQMVDEGHLIEGQQIYYNGEQVLAEKSKDVTLRIAIRPEGFADFSPLDKSMIPFPSPEDQSVTVQQSEDRSLRLSYKAVSNLVGVTVLQVFCDFWIINRTGERLFIQEKGADKDEAPEIEAVATTTVSLKQFKFDSSTLITPVMFSYHNPKSHTRALSFRTDHYRWCKDAVTIDALGSNTRFCLPEKKDTTYTDKRVYGVEVTTGPAMFALTKVVIIAPGIFIVNKTGKDMRLRLGAKDTALSVSIGAGETITYHCPEVVDKIQLSAQVEELSASWTHPFDITQEEQEEMLETPAEDDRHILLRMRAGMNQSQREIVFDIADAFNTMLFMQKQRTKKSFLKLGKKEEEEILIASLLEECDKADKNDEDLSVSLQHVKSVKAAEVEEEEEEEEKKDVVKTIDVKVQFSGFGLSIVDKKPQEVLYMCVEKLSVHFFMCEDGTIGLGLTLLKFQIDSNLPGSNYDVMLGSTEAGELDEEYAAENPDLPPKFKPFFEVSLCMPPHASITHIQYLCLSMQPMVCAIDSPTIVALLGILTDISIDIKDAELTSGRSILDSCLAFSNANVVAESVGKSYVLADMFMLQPIKIKFSFRNDPSSPLADALLPQEPWLMPFITMFNTVANILGSLDNATITLRSLFLTNYYADMMSFVKKVISFYVMEVMNKFYTLVGSFNLIGNPAELVGNVTDGVKAFFTEPIQGLMKGPGEFVGGLGKGTTQLLSKTTFGLLNSVSKITDTVGNGVASLAMSDSYQADRAAGKSNLIHGVWSGITGVFTETGAGFRDNGFIGGMKGLGEGMAGVVVKPLTGAIDSVTNVVNTVKDIAYKEKVVQPIRCPRYIPLDGVLETYNTHLSNGRALLQVANKGTGMRLQPKERYVIHCAVDNGTNVILLTTHRFLLLSPHGRLLGIAAFGTLDLKHAKEELHVSPRTSKPQNELVKNMGNMINSVTSKVDGELKLKEGDFLLESEKLCVMVENYCRSAIDLTDDEIAERVRAMLPEIHLGVKNEEEGEEKEKEVGRSAPNLADMSILSVECIGKKRSEQKNEKGVAKKLVTMYKIQAVSEREPRALWNLFIRYKDLDEMFKSLKARCNKDDLKNLHLTSQRLKIFKTKNQREEAVRKFLKVLSSSENLRSQEEVKDFFKVNAFSIRWEDEDNVAEVDEDNEDNEEISDE